MSKPENEEDYFNYTLEDVQEDVDRYLNDLPPHQNNLTYKSVSDVPKQNISIASFPSAYEMQEGGSHYEELREDPAKFIARNKLDFLEGNVVKYICRHSQKGEDLDIKKVIHYARIKLEEEYGIRSKIEYEE